MFKSFLVTLLLVLSFTGTSVYAQSRAQDRAEVQGMIDANRAETAALRREVQTSTTMPDGQRAATLRELDDIDFDSDLEEASLDSSYRADAARAARTPEERQQQYEECTAIGGGGCEYLLESEESGGSPSSPSGAAPSPAAATAEKIKDALEGYVIPTSTRNFSLSNLNSGNEASLIISTGNEENNVIYRVIRLIAMLVGTVAILLYIVAGYFMIFSQGDENQLTKGKQIITFTSLGLVIAFGAYMLIQLVMGLIYFAS